jgi:hypothetical protein
LEHGNTAAVVVVHGGKGGGGFVERCRAIDKARRVEPAGFNEIEQGGVGVGCEAAAADNLEFAAYDAVNKRWWNVVDFLCPDHVRANHANHYGTARWLRPE